MQINVTPWLPILSLVLGMICHALSSSESTAAFLAKIGIKKQLPREWLPALAILFGLASGIVDNVVGGQDIEHAVGAAIVATVSAVFGTTATRVAGDKVKGGGPPAPPPPAVMAFLALIFINSLPACAFLKTEVPTIAAETAACIVAHQNMTDEQIAILCGVTEAERVIERELLAEARKASAEEAYQAANRAKAERCTEGAQ